ncbi:ABC transporter ATP-binding protein [Amycolatopsis sp. BJA-103]|uniref:ATP-binding cassette domain-containing protein n=1 Tax=Amycolatopsis sp. BJA-103 TaxID=1911175 RepID=UPI0018EBCFE9|nr:ABC transporter ATP-binding protein [Amycolatopsis sp. BJA-103]
MIADEPAASLDTGLAYEVRRALREYANSGPAVLAITQKLPLLTATGVADSMVFLRNAPDYRRRAHDRDPLSHRSVRTRLLPRVRAIAPSA